VRRGRLAETIAEQSRVWGWSLLFQCPQSHSVLGRYILLSLTVRYKCICDGRTRSVRVAVGMLGVAPGLGGGDGESAHCSIRSQYDHRHSPPSTSLIDTRDGERGQEASALGRRKRGSPPMAVRATERPLFYPPISSPFQSLFQC
jgi:hypothetical protein